jgi:hypothetical protein
MICYINGKYQNQLKDTDHTHWSKGNALELVFTRCLVQSKPGHWLS